MKPASWISTILISLSLTTTALAADVLTPPKLKSSGHVKQLIIKYRDEPAEAMLTYRIDTARNQGAKRGVNLTRGRQTASRAHVMKFDRWMTEQEAHQLAKEIEASDPNVEYAEPDSMLQPQLFPSDARFTEQWSMFETPGGINAMSAWDTATGSGI